MALRTARLRVGQLQPVQDALLAVQFQFVQRIEGLRGRCTGFPCERHAPLELTVEILVDDDGAGETVAAFDKPPAGCGRLAMV